MQALYATATGGDLPLDNIAIGDRPEPQPGPGDVRVRMRSATLNQHDYWTLRGVVGYPITLPRILGCDGAGVVDSYGPERPAGTPEVGSEVLLYPLRFCGHCLGCLGDDPMLCRTFTMLSDGPLEGSFAQYVILPALHVVPKPGNFSWPESAALSVTYLTAYRMLFVKAGLRPGETVLVHAAASGVGSAATQMAAAAGITVFASSRSADKLKVAERLGASHLIPAGRDAAKAILQLTGGNGVDAVIETVGEATWGTSARAVRQGGKIVVAGAASGPNPGADLSRVFWRQLSIVGSTMGSLPEFLAMLQFMQRKGLKPLIDSELPLAQGRAGFEKLAADANIGKIALSIP